jgi:hypothetical protein
MEADQVNINHHLVCKLMAGNTILYILTSHPPGEVNRVEPSRGFLAYIQTSPPTGGAVLWSSKCLGRSVARKGWGHPINPVVTLRGRYLQIPARVSAQARGYPPADTDVQIWGKKVLNTQTHKGIWIQSGHL